MEKHSTRAHALLAASKADRWINCTPSARFEEAHGIQKGPSSYAQEGTLAHELATIILEDEMGLLSDDEYTNKVSEIMSDNLYQSEMMDEVQKYTGFVLDTFQKVKEKTPDAVLIIEKKFDLSNFIPEGFGSVDTAIIADGTLYIFDLKYGKGVAVKARENSQLKVYGLGAYDLFSIGYDITNIELNIVQPRLDSFSSWSIKPEELLEWANEELKVSADLAFKGEGKMMVGDWCKWCTAKNRCPKLAEESIAIAKDEFTSPNAMQALSDEQIALLLSKADTLISFLQGLSEYVTEQMLVYNKTIPGYKLVAGISRRKWVSEEKAVEAIKKQFPLLTDDDIYKSSLRGITDIEKLVSKKEFEKLASVVIKPEGRPILVPESDNRKPINPDHEVLSDFSD